MVDNSLNIHPSWREILAHEFKSQRFINLMKFLEEERSQFEVYPSSGNVFKVFENISFDNVKVVILGQDPYHGEGQAHGYSFSEPSGLRLPPSLRNIFKELEQDVGKAPAISGDLSDWVNQGVFLLNATLTVRKATPGSHQKKGWEEFTDETIKALSENREHIVFLLWGNYARAKKLLIDDSKHLVLEAAHPSPFSAHKGFFGCKHFSQANDYLREHGYPAIEW